MLPAESSDEDDTAADIVSLIYSECALVYSPISSPLLQRS